MCGNPASQRTKRQVATARILHPPQPGRGASALLLLCLFASFLLSTHAARAETRLIAAVEQIEKQGVRSQLFTLSAPTTVRVRGEGAADPKGNVFLARGWILDLDSRATVWEMDQRHGSFHGKSENWRVDEEVQLPAGRYALYFATSGGMVPLDKMLKIFGVPIGKIEATIGPTVSWNKLGESDRWGIRLETDDPGYRPAPNPAEDPGPDPGALVRVFGLSDNDVRRVRLDVEHPTEFRVRFLGEYDRSIRSFADGAWITDMRSWKQVWVPEDGTTRPAGGDFKNQEFRGTVRLDPGPYLLTVAMDGSHSPGAWNAPPPNDPDAWGISLDPVHPADRAAVRVVGDAALPEPLLAITRVGDNEFERLPFTVSRPVPVLVRALGESAGKENIYADHGWIERQEDFEPVWEMGDAESQPAGGASKNREVLALVRLTPGAYALCYVTDDSHSFEDWNAESPREPNAWGITLAAMDREGAEALRRGEAKGGPKVISLAPVGDDSDLVHRFRLTETVRFRLIAMGEGNDDPLADRGWLEDAKTGRKIWQMRYRDTEPAGGASKNRIVRADLALPSGEYELHYETDGSHAFGSWNSAPPRQPNLWGVTLIEQR